MISAEDFVSCGNGVTPNVATGSTHTMLSYCILNFAWREHCGNNSRKHGMHILLVHAMLSTHIFQLDFLNHIVECCVPYGLVCAIVLVGI